MNTRITDMSVGDIVYDESNDDAGILIYTESVGGGIYEYEIMFLRRYIKTIPSSWVVNSLKKLGNYFEIMKIDKFEFMKNHKTLRSALLQSEDVEMLMKSFSEREVIKNAIEEKEHGSTEDTSACDSIGL